MSNGTNGNTKTDDVVNDIVSNPERFGFSWYEDHVAKDGTDLGLVPLVRHLDVEKLRATFGDKFFLDSADGTSRHVTNQRIGRDMRWADRKAATPEAIKRAIVENMLGQKARRGGRVTIIEKPVFVALDGTKHETQTEAEAASLAYMMDKQLNAPTA